MADKSNGDLLMIPKQLILVTHGTPEVEGDKMSPLSKKGTEEILALRNALDPHYQRGSYCIASSPFECCVDTVMMFVGPGRRSEVWRHEALALLEEPGAKTDCEALGKLVDLEFGRSDSVILVTHHQQTYDLARSFTLKNWGKAIPFAGLPCGNACVIRAAEKSAIWLP